MLEIFSALALNALLCRLLWWSLTDWREDNRYPETHLDRAPRNPFPAWEPALDWRMRREHERDPSSW